MKSRGTTLQGWGLEHETVQKIRCCWGELLQYTFTFGKGEEDLQVGKVFSFCLLPNLRFPGKSVIILFCFVPVRRLAKYVVPSSIWDTKYRITWDTNDQCVLHILHHATFHFNLLVPVPVLQHLYPVWYILYLSATFCVQEIFNSRYSDLHPNWYDDYDWNAIQEISSKSFSNCNARHMMIDLVEVGTLYPHSCRIFRVLNSGAHSWAGPIELKISSELVNRGIWDFTFEIFFWKS